jgi:hypothetical protein
MVKCSWCRKEFKSDNEPLDFLGTKIIFCPEYIRNGIKNCVGVFLQGLGEGLIASGGKK